MFFMNSLQNPKDMLSVQHNLGVFKQINDNHSSFILEKNSVDCVQRSLFVINMNFPVLNRIPNVGPSKQVKVNAFDF